MSPRRGRPQCNKLSTPVGSICAGHLLFVPPDLVSVIPTLLSGLEAESVDHTNRLPCPLACGLVQPIKKPQGEIREKKESENSEWFLSM